MEQDGDPKGWRLLRLEIPTGLDQRPMGPFRTSRDEFLWYGTRTEPDRPPWVVRRYPDGSEDEIVRTSGDDGVSAANPSGSHILHLSENLESTYYNRNLYISRADGSDRRLVRSSPALLYGGAWSRDGRLLMVEISANPDSLIVMTPGGRTVASVVVDDSEAKWCGDTRRVILTRRVEAEVRLSLFDVDSGELTGN